jgi:hypothetical protein
MVSPEIVVETFCLRLFTGWLMWKQVGLPVLVAEAWRV